jgi:hypothetical protein
VLQVRASVPPTVLRRSIEDQIHAVEPNLPVFEVMSMETALQGGNGLFLFRVAAIFAGILGGLGLLLAVSGVYGVVSYGVNQRTHEIGIRMALGAQQQNILRLVILQGVKLVLAGLVLGIAVSAGLARVLESLRHACATERKWRKGMVLWKLIAQHNDRIADFEICMHYPPVIVLGDTTNFGAKGLFVELQRLGRVAAEELRRDGVEPFGNWFYGF